MSRPRNAFIAFLLAALVVLAGCSGGGTDPGTTTDLETTTDSAATDSATTDSAATDSATTDSAATDSATTDATAATETQTDSAATDDTISASSANATAVKRTGVSAMADVEMYRIGAHIDTVVSSNNVRRRTVTNSTGAVNRLDRELRINRTARVAGRSSTVSTYVVDRTLYQRSPQFTRTFSSKWIRQNLSGNFSQRWSALDTLTRQRELLNISSAELVGEQTVDGTETYVLRAAPDPERYANLSANVTNRQVGTVENVSVTYWIAKDTHLPVKSDTSINSTVSVRGQEMDLHQELRLRFSGYGDDVSVELPAAAETAVSLDDQLNTTTEETTARNTTADQTTTA
ncbi:DUF6612 family protein [Halorussus marinus]|uniref:DUF6612 family protein n=1 Tax=Halorussus marinus TaxID=2505976 RepID=UPI00106ED01C|nr:DUF6612 family protein [Halorussus marinus]